MHIKLELPEDIAERLESTRKDLPRGALESLALEAYGLTRSPRRSFGGCLASKRECKWTPF